MPHTSTRNSGIGITSGTASYASGFTAKQMTSANSITTTSTATSEATYRYRHNGLRVIARNTDWSVSGNGVFANVIGSCAADAPAQCPR